jgi:cytochrome c oxidase subunit 3
MKLNILKNPYQHSFHLVSVSPWPLLSAFSAFMLVDGGVLYMHGYLGGELLRNCGFWMLMVVMLCWWRDVIREGTIEGQHTSAVQKGLRIGMLLFLASEVMFFFSFFWAFFHLSFNSNADVGSVSPSFGLTTVDPFAIPLLNSILLLSSGASVTWAHHAVITGKKQQSITALFFTILLALIFTSVQGYEYITGPFSISDGAIASIFYLLTGFHGFHGAPNNLLNTYIFVGTKIRLINAKLVRIR